MNDRELLELAARANWAREVADDEIDLRYCEINGGILYLHADNQDHDGHDREFVWNPLEEDGDALRLAVKLRFVVAVHGHEIEIFSADDGDCLESISIPPDGSRCPLEMTRRAIVGAAAEIGKARSD